MISFNAAAPGNLNLSLPGAVRPLPAPPPPRLVEVDARARAVRAVMVCLSTEVSRFDALMRKGLEAARELDARLYLVHVETLSEAIRGAAKERLRERLEDARASHDDVEVVWLKAREPVEVLLEFAREARIKSIFVGHSRTRHRLFHRSVCRALLDKARSVSVEIVGIETRK